MKTRLTLVFQQVGLQFIAFGVLLLAGCRKEQLPAPTEMRTNLAYATITAPFDGVITPRLVGVGDLASDGKPAMRN